MRKLRCRKRVGYVVPWGGMHPGLRKDLLEALKSKNDGGSRMARTFWQWCEDGTMLGL